MRVSQLQQVGYTTARAHVLTAVVVPRRTLAASRFAPHLEKCMGMGRTSSRQASRRLATSNKDSYREGCHEEEDDVEDEDWIEPGKITNNRRKRDKNSPRRYKILKFRTNGTYRLWYRKMIF